MSEVRRILILLLGTALLAPGGVAQSAAPASANPGDQRKVPFVLPFKAAFAKAKAENRLLFIKPIYGGLDQAGADDYRCGSW